MCSYARQHKNAGADDGPDAQARELHRTEDAVQTILALQLLDQRLVRLDLK